MGPVSHYLSPLVPKEPQLWQDPILSVDHELVNENDIYILKEKISKSGLSVSDLIKTAWGSAAIYRGTDRRGKANGSQTSRLYWTGQRGIQPVPAPSQTTSLCPRTP